MKYRYLIVDTFDGDVKGTNNDRTAQEFAECDDFFVIDTQADKWMITGSQSVEIEEKKSSS